jgi:hypothetical protein
VTLADVFLAAVMVAQAALVASYVDMAEDFVTRVWPIARRVGGFMEASRRIRAGLK